MIEKQNRPSVGDFATPFLRLTANMRFRFASPKLSFPTVGQLRIFAKR